MCYLCLLLRAFHDAARVDQSLRVGGEGLFDIILPGFSVSDLQMIFHTQQYDFTFDACEGEDIFGQSHAAVFVQFYAAREAVEERFVGEDFIRAAIAIVELLRASIKLLFGVEAKGFAFAGGDVEIDRLIGAADRLLLELLSDLRWDGQSIFCIDGMFVSACKNQSVALSHVTRVGWYPTLPHNATLWLACAGKIKVLGANVRSGWAQGLARSDRSVR